MALLPLGAWATTTTWNFESYSSFTSDDATNLAADATNWSKDGSNNRYGCIKALSAEALTANSVELDFAKGLKFTATAGTDYSTAKVIVSAKDKALMIKQNVVITVPNCTANQLVRIYVKNGSSKGTLSTTNLTAISDFSTDISQSEWTTLEGFATADGNVTFTLLTSSLLYIRLIKVIDTSKVFDEAETYSDGGGSGISVLLKRNIKKDYWNALCLPMAVTNAVLTKYLGADVKLAEYTSYSSGSLGFTTMATPVVTAHTPYLVKTSKDVNYIYFETTSPSSSSAPGSDKWVTPTSAEYTFKGIYSPATPGTDDVFLGRNNTLYKGNGTNSIKGFRAYFSPVAAGAHELFITIDGEEATNIIGIETESHSTLNGVVYNLQGQKVANSVNGLSNGVYIVKGKKIVIK